MDRDATGQRVCQGIAKGYGLGWDLLGFTEPIVSLKNFTYHSQN